MKKELFRGSAVAITTPFDQDGKVDCIRFGEQIDRQIACGTNAIVVCGTTGEASTLTEDEYNAVVSFCVRRVAGRVPVIVGAGSNNTRHCLERCLAAQAVGADGVLLVTPYYNKTTQSGLVSHFTHIADRIKLPVVLYNVPSRTGMSCTADTYAALAQHPNIVAVKEASGNFTLVLETREKCGDDLAIYSGNDDQIVPILALGGAGVISVLANVAPKDTAEICRLYFDGQSQQAASLQVAYSALIRALFRETNPIPVKAALAMQGLDTGYVRLPLVPISPASREELLAAMQERKLL